MGRHHAPCPDDIGAVSEVPSCTAETQSHLKLREMVPVLTSTADLAPYFSGSYRAQNSQCKFRFNTKTSEKKSSFIKACGLEQAFSKINMIRKVIVKTPLSELKICNGKKNNLR